MQLTQGQTAVVTGAGSGIGAALVQRFAAAGLNVVLADIDEAGMAAVASSLPAAVEHLTVRTDVSREDEVNALATAASERFGSINVVCNNAGVASQSDPWLGPMAAWEWVLGVNLFGVIYGVRAFLPHLVLGGGGHIVNTASMAGLFPGFSPAYDASKHAVVALTEDLYLTVDLAGLPIGVSVLCPGWVSTGIMDADRNWPDELGDRPDSGASAGLVEGHVRRAVAEGMTPAEVADRVATAIEADRFWVFPHPDWVELAARRWETIHEGADPVPVDGVPGLPPIAELRAAVQALLTTEPPG